jgi:hypothetical protein
MRIRKLLLVFIFTTLVTIETISLSLTLLAASSTDITIGILRVSFYCYLLALSAFFISKTTVAEHAKSVVHLGALTLLSSLLEFCTGILPNTPPPVAQVFIYTPVVSLWTVSLALNLLSTVLIFILPTGPDLHYPPSLIYTSNVDFSGAPTGSNVCGSTSASLLSILTFSYTTPIVYLANHLPSFEILNLPILPAVMRATYNYNLFRHTEGPTNTVWAVAYKLFANNRKEFLYLFALSSISGVTFYMPSFFVQRLVQYLETDPLREHRAWGFVYVTVILFFLIFQTTSA